MAGKSTDWRPGPTVCRCCLSEGCYKDISTEYFWMGKREVYAEMLSDTLNLTISYSKSGGPYSNSRLICEPCISKLRDASDFKRQVQECEKTFMNHLDGCGSSLIEIDALTGPSSDVKIERVKLEKALSENDDFDDHLPFPDDDDDDDLDDQPLTKLASKIPKKETVDIMDLLDNAKVAEKRKSSTKLKSSANKKIKIVKAEIRPAKPSASKPSKVDKKKKDKNPTYYAKWNAQTIIQYTTALPFKLPESAMVCVYCCDSFDQPSNFREHMSKTHKDFNISVAFIHVQRGTDYVKADCTEIRCRICSDSFDTLATAAQHLIDTHKKRLYLDYDIAVQPFQLGDNKYVCGVCQENHCHIRNLSRHLQQHFLQCTCELCGKSFTNNNNLKIHLKTSCPLVPKQRRCRKCKVIIMSSEDHANHLKVSENCRQHICPVCGERFANWKLKRGHMDKAHGVPPKVYKCPECDMVFQKPAPYRSHFVTVHTNKHFDCANCGRKFDTEYALAKHSVTHSNERSYSCHVCSKLFPRKSTLSSHMWIHSEIKRFECKLCTKTFNQKVSYRTHMKSYHPGLEDSIA